ncbi:MAG: hypothetical protein AVDCRST_MAG53-3214 [uncultured Solirubrobacteraceae bacterium]|uniref:L,D-TPase catalytic domain-containing protein n=1 Tax=uncultured Solirubrobacteraceae bacterium TaxID=1162706 RepID=A0A6J4TD66_9ACTN|nr:MAG: hypothetical protein AVDCRST_MAG53-3214 [uncultured Solirubrobacteraceae bacterium]
MRARSLVLVSVLTVAVAANATAAIPPPAERIAPGVTAGGIDVSNLTVLQAAQKLKVEATPGLTAKPVVLGVAGRPWTLTAEQAKLKVNGTRTAQAALALAAPGDVPLVVQHSQQAVAKFVDGVARKVRKPPRNATLRITLRRMVVRRAKAGRGLDAVAARKRVDAALADPAADRTLHQRLSRLRAPINANDVRRLNRTVITIDKSNFRLRLFKNLKFAKSYGVAVGLPAYPTPSGRFSIASKQVNPTWSVPNSPWAGELQGTTVAGGSAANPLKARWMGIANGIGIHGTGEGYSIGKRASHGCIRMHVADVIALYKRVSVGTQVLIA